MEECPKGYYCECGKYHEFPAWVYAHWDERLDHTCECGRRNSLFEGEVEQ